VLMEGGCCKCLGTKVIETGECPVDDLPQGLRLAYTSAWTRGLAVRDLPGLRLLRLVKAPSSP